MTAKGLLSKAKTLPKDERIRLVQDLWDTIAEQQESIDISEEHRRILTERLGEHEENPSDVVPWEVAKADIHTALERHRSKRSATVGTKPKRTASAGKRKAAR